MSATQAAGSGGTIGVVTRRVDSGAYGKPGSLGYLEDFTWIQGSHRFTVEAGHLVVSDESGSALKVFAPGSWSNVMVREDS